MKKLLLTSILLMSVLAALAGCGGGKSSSGLPPADPRVTTIAGLAGLRDSTDGTGTDARFSRPGGIAIDGNGNLYVADTYNNIIRKLTWNGTGYTVSRIAGAADCIAGSADGDGLTVAKFNKPYGITADSSGNLYVVDGSNYTIRKLTWDGTKYTVSRIAGVTGSLGSADGDGLTVAKFYNPFGITADSSGNLYVADQTNNTIRKLTWNGTVYTVSCIAGAAYGSTDGDGLTQALFKNPTGITIDGNGNLYVADTYNSTIRKLTWNGADYTVSRIAGSPGSAGTTDGTGSTARFNFPKGITVDSSGNYLYVADTSNHTIRKLTKSGADYIVTTIAGLAGTSGSTDGPLTAASFNSPIGITIDGSGNLFVTEFENHTIRKITF